MKKCLNCQKEFIVSNKKTRRNFMYCSKKCYWEYRLKKFKEGIANDKSKSN